MPFFAPDYFGTKDVTLPRLRKFTLDVIQRLTLDNPDAVFKVLIADLTRYYTALFGAITEADAGTSQRRTNAQQMWGALADLQHQLEEDKELVNYKSKKTPAILTDFFPNGRKEYAQATLLTADVLFARAAKAAATHAATLGSDFDADRYADLYAAFREGRDGTGAGDEQTAKGRAEASSHRQDLTLRLTDAVKQVAATFPRDEARCQTYFRIHLLQAPARARATAV